MEPTQYRKDMDKFIFKKRHAAYVLARIRKGAFTMSKETPEQLEQTIEFCDVAMMELRTARRKEHDARSAARKLARLSARNKYKKYEPNKDV